MQSLFARTVFACLAAGGASLVVVACGDDSAAGGAGGTTSSTTTAKTASSTSSGSTSMCIKPGEVGNELGVGHYCTPGGGECNQFPKATLCLADVGQDEWFCTRIGCDATTDCGAGAGCLLDPQGSACVLCKCDASGSGCTPDTSASVSSSASSGSGG